MQYPNRLRLARLRLSVARQRHLELRQVGKELGVSASYLSRLERGMRDCMVTEAMKLAQFYQTDVTWLFCLTPEAALTPEELKAHTSASEQHFFYPPGPRSARQQPSTEPHQKSE